MRSRRQPGRSRAGQHQPPARREITSGVYGVLSKRVHVGKRFAGDSSLGDGSGPDRSGMTVNTGPGFWLAQGQPSTHTASGRRKVSPDSASYTRRVCGIDCSPIWELLPVCRPGAQTAAQRSDQVRLEKPLMILPKRCTGAEHTVQGAGVG